jgi:tetratricopeptide (TPR) repeat protein
LGIHPAAISAFICFLLAGCALIPQPIRSSYLSWTAKKELEKGERWAQRRQHDRAEAAFLEALEHYPDRAEVFIHLGDLYLTVQSYDKALKAYREALALNPEDYEAQAGVWATLLEQASLDQEVKQKVLKEIETYLEKTSEVKNPAEHLYAAYLGLDYLHEDERKPQLWEQILQLKPDARILKGLAQDASEHIFGEADTQKRLALIEKFYSLFPPSPQSNLVHQYELWLLATVVKDSERLRESGRKWISQEPDNRIAHFAVGYWFTEKEGDLETAMEALKKALELLKQPDPRDKPENQPDRDWKRDLRDTKGRYLDTLGWVYFKLDRFEEAQAALEAAARILDFNHRLFYHLGALYEHQGDQEKAFSAYVRSLEADDELQEAYTVLKRLTKQFDPNAADLHKFLAHKKDVTPFTEVTESVGLASVKGGRVAWGDYDGDGDEDLLVDGHRLFRNDEGKAFVEMTDTVGLKELPGAVGGVWADFNNDGHLDFFMMAAGGGSTGRFWKNKGDGTFVDTTQAAIYHLDDNPTEGVGWGDYDGDGWVDLYLANYEKPYSRAIHLGIGTPDILLKNNGDETFTDVTEQAGLVTLEKMNGRGVNWGDYNNDGLLDIFVSNYRLDPNFLWRNNGDGTFTNVAREQGVEGQEKKGRYGHTIGSEWGDYDNDGDLDLFSANLAHPRYIGLSDKSMLLENSGHPHYRFKERTRESGIRYQETHSDPSLTDYDNDGDLDLFITAIYPKGKSTLYQNNGHGKFEDVTWLAGVRVANGWGSAFADFDRDGDLDLVVGSYDGVRLFANDGNSNNWLHVKVVSSRCNRDGIGSRVIVKSRHLEQIREVQGGKGTGAQHSLPVEFGLGHDDGPVEVKVRNSCGQVTRRIGVNPNQMITVGN